MGTKITLNDTLQITKEQGFPKQLDIISHQAKPVELTDIQDMVFEFYDKESIRAYQAPPVRVFLVENINGKWLYWGLCHVLETKIDLVNQTTSGKFKIIKIYTPEEMKQAYDLIDMRKEFNYFIS